MTRPRQSLADLYRRGVLATLPALLASSVVSVLLNRPWTLEPIAERVMVLTPVDLAQQVLLRLGGAARPLALFGALAIAIAIGGCVSVLAGEPAWRTAYGRRADDAAHDDRAAEHAAEDAGTRGHARRADAAWRLMAFLRPWLALCVLLFVMFVLFRPLDPLSTVIMVATYATCLAVAARPCGAGSTGARRVRAPRGRAPSGRRAFLLDSTCILGTTAALVALLLVEPWYRGLAARRWGGRLFAFRVPPPGPGFALAGLTPAVTPPARFYYLSKNLVDPEPAADDWTLRLDGLVARPLTLRFAELLALPARSLWVTQECVSNPVGGPLISCGLFTGVPLRRLLLRAGPLAGASTLVMRAPDGHADSIPIALAMNPDVLLAYGLDGAYLTRAHGFPARVVVPGSYGFKSVKWVTRLELVERRFTGTWQALGWSADAIVRTTARIDLARRTRDGLLVAGVAFAGARGIRAVQVRANGGAWATARLGTPLSPLTWVQWRLTLPLTAPSPITLALEARAIDDQGAVQDARRRDVFPAGATGYHRVTVTV